LISSALTSRSHSFALTLGTHVIAGAVLLVITPDKVKGINVLVITFLHILITEVVGTFVAIVTDHPFEGLALPSDAEIRRAKLVVIAFDKIKDGNI
jgi:hypothetical protein